jgi:WD40 repeat protein
LTLAAYVTAGGIRGAVARMAERAYDALDADAQAATRLLLLRLAGPGEADAVARRPVPLAEVATLAGGRAPALIESLARARLLTVAAGHIEVAHEALFREWPRLRGWLEEDEAGRRLRQHLAPAALEWQARGHDPADLYRGARLTAALEWSSEHRSELTELERQFLEAGRAAAEAEAGRRRRTVRRLRMLAASLAGALALVAAAGYVAVSQRDRASAAALAADARALRARAAAAQRLDHALLYSVQAYAYEPSGPSRAALLAALQRSPEAAGVMLADAGASRIAVSPDGRRVAVGDPTGRVYVWDAVSRRRMATVDHWANEKRSALALSFSPHGDTVAVSRVLSGKRGEKATSFVELRTSPPRITEPATPPGALVSIFTPDGTDLVTVFQNGTVGIVDVATGRVRRPLTPNLGRTDADGPNPELIASPGGRFVVARNQHGSLAWDVDAGRLVGRFPRDHHVVISPDGRSAAFRRDDGAVGVRDLATGRERVIAGGESADIMVRTWSSGGVAWAPDGATFATASADGAVRMWDPATLTVRGTLRGHSGLASAVQFAPDGRTLYSGGGDRTVFAWRPTQTSRLTEKFAVVIDVAGAAIGRFGADGHVFLGVTDEGKGIQISDLDAPGPARSSRLPAPADLPYGISDAAIAADGRRAAILDVDSGAGIGRVAVFDLDTGTVLPHRIVIDASNGPIIDGAVALSADGESLYAGGGGGTLGAYDAASGRRTALEYKAGRPIMLIGPPAGSTGLLAVASSPNDDVLVDRVDVVDTRTGRPVVRVPIVGDTLVAPPVLSPDGSRLVAGLVFGDVIIWDTAADRLVARHRVADGPVMLVAVSPDGRHVLASRGDGTSLLWPMNGTPDDGVVLTSGGTGVVYSGFRDGGKRVVMAPADRRPLLWDVRPATLIRLACDIVRRDLTGEEWAAVLPDRPHERTCTDSR